jgi:hypothetical protein
MKILVHTQPLEFNVPVKDGDMDRSLVKRAVSSASDRYTFAHKLGRTPVKAYVVRCSGGFITCKISTDTSGREQADAEKITLEFSATGIAVVCIE